MKLENKVKGILFDKDGTLIEFESFWFEVMNKVFLNLKSLYQLDDALISELKQHSGVLSNGFDKESLIQYKSTTEIAKSWAPFLMARSVTMEKTYCGDEVECALVLYHLIDQASQSSNFEATAMASAQKVLKKLKDMGYVLGIATADTLLSTTKSLKDTGLYEYFDFFGCDDGHTPPKPNPSLGRAFEEAMHLGKGEYCMVGDSLTDYEFSKNCAIPFVGIYSTYGQLKHLSEEVIMIHSLEELLEVVCE